MNKFIVQAFILLILDRALKALALKGFVYNTWFKLFLNQGIIFSLPFNNLLTIIFGLLIILIIIYFLIKSWQNNNYKSSLALLLILLGSASNLYDRIVYGGVIDYLNFGFLSVFNLSDVYIVLGILLLLKTNLKTRQNT
jgi:signal peptidase II